MAVGLNGESALPPPVRRPSLSPRTCGIYHHALCLVELLVHSRITLDDPPSILISSFPPTPHVSPQTPHRLALWYFRDA